jgi:hypothetical protein
VSIVLVQPSHRLSCDCAALSPRDDVWQDESLLKQKYEYPIHMITEKVHYIFEIVKVLNYYQFLIKPTHRPCFVIYEVFVRIDHIPKKCDSPEWDDDHYVSSPKWT